MSLNLKNAFKPAKVPKFTKVGDAGYDNSRENIDPHIRTKVVNTSELNSYYGAFWHH